jgi:GGDEF domain-containing protein
MSTDFDVLGTPRQVSTSIGIAVGKIDDNDGSALLRRADEALYAAKAAGRNTFRSAP